MHSCGSDDFEPRVDLSTGRLYRDWRKNDALTLSILKSLHHVPLCTLFELQLELLVLTFTTFRINIQVA